MFKKLSDGQRLSHGVASQISNLIKWEKLKPGDKLPNELELTKQFGVSRTTLREAVKHLASRNVVEIVRGRGTFVSQTPGVSSDPLGLDFVSRENLAWSLIEARLIVEPTVAQLAAERATAADVKRLAGIVEEMASLTAELDSWRESEVRYHRAVAQASRNPVVMRLLPVINDAIVKTLRQGPPTATHNQAALNEHRVILEAIRARDPHRAFRTMMRHLKNSYRRFLDTHPLEERDDMRVVPVRGALTQAETGTSR